MSQHDIEERDDGLELAKRMAEEEEGVGRRPRGWAKYLIPTVAVLGIGVGNLMAGAVFVELIFSRPGMGTLIYNGIQSRNFPVARAGILVVAFLFVLANLLADLVYTYLDPRIQLDKVRG
mgnify:CR=1 FL=1